MALTLSYGGLDEIKGSYQGNPASKPYHLFRGVLNFTGTYATGGDQYDLCNLFTGPAFTVGSSPAGSRMGVTAIKVNWVKVFGDFYDGTTELTFADAQTALADGGTVTSISAASTKNLATLKLYTTAATTHNGVGTAELTNATAVSGSIAVVFACELTFGAVGAG
jgi:hypothetical protein